MVRRRAPRPPPPSAARHRPRRDHSQVCDVVHDSKAFDGVALAVDEVVVDLEVDGWSDRWTVITRRRMDGGGLGRGTIAVEGGARKVTELLQPGW